MWPCPHVHARTNVAVGMDKERETTQEATARAVYRHTHNRGQGHHLHTVLYTSCICGIHSQQVYVINGTCICKCTTCAVQDMFLGSH